MVGRKRRTKSLQPNVVSWDVEHKISVQPELFGAVIEKFLTHKRNSSGSVGDDDDDMRKRSTSERSLESSSKQTSKQKNRLRATSSSSAAMTATTSSHDTSSFKHHVEKRYIVVDEFDHPRRLSFGGARKVSCRSEDSVEDALKKLNI